MQSKKKATLLWHPYSIVYCTRNKRRDPYFYLHQLRYVVRPSPRRGYRRLPSSSNSFWLVWPLITSRTGAAAAHERKMKVERMNWSYNYSQSNLDIERNWTTDTSRDRSWMGISNGGGTKVRGTCIGNAYFSDVLSPAIRFYWVSSRRHDATHSIRYRNFYFRLRQLILDLTSTMFRLPKQNIFMKTLWTEVFYCLWFISTAYGRYGSQTFLEFRNCA